MANETADGNYKKLPRRSFTPPITFFPEMNRIDRCIWCNRLRNEHEPGGWCPPRKPEPVLAPPPPEPEREPPLPEIRRFDFENFMIFVSRGADDQSIVVSIDTTEANGPHDHWNEGYPRISIYLNDATVYDFETEEPPKQRGRVARIIARIASRLRRR